jgi:RNA 2',3'-cyclic 3'-phosphodiesterase
MRLFVAVDLDAGARREVGRLIARMRSETRDERSRRISWVSSHHLHLTLHFLGNTTDEIADRLVAAIAAPIDLPAFEIVFGGVGTFPSRGRPNVIWLGIAEGKASLVELHGVVGQRLTSVGCELEARPFSPHLTLARLKFGSGRGATRTESRASLRGRNSDRAFGRMLVERVTLYESRLGREGATHIAIARGPLRPGAGPRLQ